MKDVPFTGEGILNMNSLISAVSAPILLKEDPLHVRSCPSDKLGFFQLSMEGNSEAFHAEANAVESRDLKRTDRERRG